MPDQRAFQGDAFEQDAFQAPLVIDTGATIASGESFGRPTVQRVARAVGVSSTESFGAAKLARVAAAAGAGSAQNFGAPALSRLVQPSGVTTGETFGRPSVTRAVAGSAIASGETVSVPAVARVARTQAIAGVETVAAVSLLRLVTEQGISTGEQLGQPQVTLGAAPFSGVVAASSIVSSEAFGTPMVSLATQTGGSGLQHGINYLPRKIRRDVAKLEPASPTILRLTGIASAENFGTPTVDILAADMPQPRIVERETGAPDRDTLLLIGAL